MNQPPVDYAAVVLFLFIGGFGGLVCLFVLYTSLRQIREWSRWQPVNATVIETGTAAREGRMSSRLPLSDPLADAQVTYYSPEVRYAYDFAGQSHESSEMGGLSFEISSRRAALKRAQRYPIGSSVTAWVNPKKPSDAVLRRGMPA